MPDIYDIITSIARGHAYDKHANEFSASDRGPVIQIDSEQDLANLILEVVNDPNTKAAYNANTGMITIANAEKNVVISVSNNRQVSVNTPGGDAGTIVRPENRHNDPRRAVQKFNERISDFRGRGDAVVEANGPTEVRAMLEKFAEQEYGDPRKNANVQAGMRRNREEAEALRKSDTDPLVGHERTQAIADLDAKIAAEQARIAAAAQAQATRQQEQAAANHENMQRQQQAAEIYDKILEHVKNGEKLNYDKKTGVLTIDLGTEVYEVKMSEDGKSAMLTETTADTDVTVKLDTESRLNHLKTLVTKGVLNSLTEDGQRLTKKEFEALKASDPLLSSPEWTNKASSGAKLSPLKWIADATKRGLTAPLVAAALALSQGREARSQTGPVHEPPAVVRSFSPDDDGTPPPERGSAAEMAAKLALDDPNRAPPPASVDQPTSVPLRDTFGEAGAQRPAEPLLLRIDNVDFTTGEYAHSNARPPQAVVSLAAQQLEFAESRNSGGLSLDPDAATPKVPVAGIPQSSANVLLQTFVADGRSGIEMGLAYQEANRGYASLDLTSGIPGLSGGNQPQPFLLGDPMNLSFPDVSGGGVRMDGSGLPNLMIDPVTGMVDWTRAGTAATQTPSYDPRQTSISLVELPVERVDGLGVESKMYMVDPNFGHMAMSGGVNSPEARLAETEIGRSIARRMSVDGYIEITPAVSAELTRAGFFEEGGRLSPENMSNMVRETQPVDSAGLPRGDLPSDPHLDPTRRGMVIGDDVDADTRRRSPKWNDPGQIRGAASLSAGTSVGMSAFGLYSKLTNDVFRQHFERGGAAANWATASVGADGAALALDATHFGAMRYSNHILNSVDDAARAARAAGNLGQISRLAKLAGPAGLLVSVGAGGFEFMAAREANMGYEAAEAIGATTGGLAGGFLTGLGTGALAGSWLGPIGSAICGLGGAVIGGLGGAWAGGELSKAVLGEKLQELYDEGTQQEIDKMVENTNTVLDRPEFKTLLDSLEVAEGSKLSEKAHAFENAVAMHNDFNDDSNRFAVLRAQTDMQDEIEKAKDLPTLSYNELQDLKALEKAFSTLHAMESMRKVPEDDPEAEIRRKENIERLEETLNRLRMVRETDRVNTQLSHAAHDISRQSNDRISELESQAYFRRLDQHVIDNANAEMVPAGLALPVIAPVAPQLNEPLQIHQWNRNGPTSQNSVEGLGSRVNVRGEGDQPSLKDDAYDPALEADKVAVMGDVPPEVTAPTVDEQQPVTTSGPVV